MTQIVVLRGGEMKMRTSANIRADGTIWMRTAKGEGPLLDGSVKTDLTKEQILDLAKQGKFDAIPAAAYAKMGKSETGLMVMTCSDYDASKRQEREAYEEQHPEIVERRAISALFAEAERIIDRNAEEDDTGRGYNMRAEASKRLAAWREKYPEASKEEDRQHLIRKAEHEESMAVGALTYDADGWIDSAGQQKRHDEFIANAKALREQAANL